MKNFFFFIVFLFVVMSAHAQTWLWGKGLKNGNAEGYSLSIDSHYNLLQTGSFFSSLTFGVDTLVSFSNGDGDMYIVKYDSIGNVIWVRQSKGVNDGFAGCFGNSSAFDKAGNVYVTGAFNDTVYFGNVKVKPTNGARLDEAVFTVKYNSNGKVDWVKQSSTSPNVGENEGYSVSTDSWGNVYVAGIFSDSISFDTCKLHTLALQSNVFLVKYDSNGNVLWARQANTGIHSAWAYSVATDLSGNAFMSGMFGDTVFFGANKLIAPANAESFLVKYDSSGNVLWARQDNNSGGSVGNYVATDNNGNSFVTGYFLDSISFGTFAFNSQQLQDIFLVKRGPSGNVLWAKAGKILDSNKWTGFYLATDNVGGVYLTGGGEVVKSLYRRILFDTVTLIVYDSSGFDGASILVKFDNLTGKAMCGSIVPGGGDDQNSVAVDPTGLYCYLGGDLAANVIFGQDTLYDALTNEAPFIARWQPCMSTVGVNELVATSESVKVYPNPSNGEFTVLLQNVHDKSQIRVYNTLGEEVYAGQLNSQTTQVNINSATTGLYLYRVTGRTGEKIADGKLLIR